MIERLAVGAWGRREADHLMVRAGNWGGPGDREALYRVGERSGVGGAVDWLLDREEDWSRFPLPGWAQGGGNGEPSLAEVNKLEVAGWLLDQFANAAPVQAKLFKFWVDHFPVDIGVVEADRAFVYLFRHFNILRTGALGSFRTLLNRVSWSEAMMRMLDLDTSSKLKPNENWARELMELFTLGVDAGYTEQDVAGVARAFTGRRLRSEAPFTPYLLDLVVDRGVKSLLGVELPELPNLAGAEHGPAVVDVLLARDECARHLVWKLWRYFVSPEVPEPLWSELAARFKDPAVHDYRVKPLLRDMFTSAAFYDPVVVGRQVKDAVDFVVSCGRLLEMGVPPARTSGAVLKELGYEPSRPPTIEGWAEPDGVGNAWVGAGALVARMNLPTLWTHGDPQAVLGGGAFSAEQPYPRLDVGRLLGSPSAGRESFPLALDLLEERLLPFHSLGVGQREVLERQFARTVRESEGDAYRDTVRMVMGLPEFQLQ